MTKPTIEVVQGGVIWVKQDNNNTEYNSYSGSIHWDQGGFTKFHRSPTGTWFQGYTDDGLKIAHRITDEVLGYILDLQVDRNSK
jgi:hypothetical protein